jgi:hypothetical protein
MPKPKIDLVKLDHLFRSGKTPKQAAEYFRVSEVAIWKAKKKLSVAVVKNIALESAHKVVGKHLDTITQLQKINEYANELLDLLMRWNRGDEAALQILESQVSTKKVRVGDKEEFVKEYKFRDPRELALKAMTEIRGQLALQLEIFETLYNVQSVHEFQREILEAIREVAPDVREKIIRKLKEGKMLRQSVELR